MSTETAVGGNRSIRWITDRKEQDAETYRYWQSRPAYERMEAVAEIVRDAYYMKGIDLDAQRPQRTLVRIQQTQR
ncbi:MAG: hypothetical protein ACYCRE_00360 [Acidobacteriaceae bacterium]